MPIIPNIPDRLSGDGGLNFMTAKIPPTNKPSNPALIADINSGVANNSFIFNSLL